MGAIPARAVLLIVIGVLFGPLYYLYATHFSGTTAQAHVLSERAERWTLPDGSIRRTRSGLAFKPLALALHPEMNPVQLRFTFHAAEAAGSQPGANEYAASLTFMDHPLMERALHVTVEAGKTARMALPPFEATAPGDYEFLLQEIGTPGVPVTRVELEVRRNLETPNALVVTMGVVLIGAGIAWIAVCVHKARS